jgi:hypothetical protein
MRGNLTRHALILLLALGAELQGVTMPEQLTVDGKTLKLNGMGLRKKAFFKVYVAGLYLESQSTDPDKIIAADEARRVEMKMKRDLGKDKIAGAIVEGLERNSKEKLPALKARLDRFTDAVPDLKEGQVLSITYVPGKGTTIVGGAGNPVTVEGKEFADAVFLCWLGKNPVDDDLKKGLLGEK